jgi:hypothetical protein
MIRLLIALTTAAALASVGVAYADSLVLYMMPGDYAAYACDGSVSATVGDGVAYGACTRKGQTEWDVTAYCFGDLTVALPTSQSLTIACN